MQIHFKGTNYDLPANITALARKKLEGLAKYIGENKENSRAYMDLGKETEAHQNGKIWRADINFDVDGDRFYAKAVEETIEKAIDKSVNDVARELQSARKRQQSLVRKGEGVIKSLMRGIEA